MAIPDVILAHLQKLEPGAQFSGSLPRVLSSSGRRYYAKVGSPQEAEQMIGEAESLKVMYAAAPGLVPKLYASGIVGQDDDDSESNSKYAGKSCFISDYVDLGSLDNEAAAVLGKRLATEMHAYENPEGRFGFGIPTYCGATRLQNGWFDTWEACYSSLIDDLNTQLKKKGRFSELCAKTEEVRSKIIPKLLGSLQVKPVILHGDLWSGNTGVDKESNEPIIFDPSSYYGHNEADLAIGRMFGGISPSFLRVYHEHLPKTEPAEQYELRQELYQLFHYLNHTNLFGSSYEAGAMSKIRTLLRAYDTGKL